jgi:hypothetical protein
MKIITKQTGSRDITAHLAQSLHLNRSRSSLTIHSIVLNCLLTELLKTLITFKTKSSSPQSTATSRSKGSSYTNSAQSSGCYPQTAHGRCSGLSKSSLRCLPVLITSHSGTCGLLLIGQTTIAQFKISRSPRSIGLLPDSEKSLTGHCMLDPTMMMPGTLCKTTISSYLFINLSPTLRFNYTRTCCCFDSSRYLARTSPRRPSLTSQIESNIKPLSDITLALDRRSHPVNCGQKPVEKLGQRSIGIWRRH